MTDEIRRGRQYEDGPIEMSPGAWLESLGTASPDILGPTVGPYYPSITCPRCGMTSWNSTDVAEGYCGNCHDWTSAR